MTATDGGGGSVAGADLAASVRDGRTALGALAEWLRARYGSSRVLGVGHRVVHGGAKYAAPCIVTPAVLRISARWCRWRRCISRTTWRRSRP